ncbi:ribonuclease HII [Clostridium sp. CAG:1000]|jgi:ribonuclease HII|nr:ribonuclease HII [Clostridium sp. CAG:1000]
MKEFENELYNNKINFIAGIDEVGRGPLVGPVVTAAVILPKDFYDERINDSKKLTEKKRELLYDVIMENALSVGIGISSPEVIDEINILNATKKAMIEAINNLSIKPEHLLIDAVKLDIDIPQTSIIKGDAKSQSIASASIIAKVTRDRMMVELDKKYPMYDFKHNKGYGTKKHIEALYKYGPLKEHRKSFAPVSELTNKK